jgi:methyl-accepting chemotaxis protein
MAIAEDMKRLTENIMISSDVRLKAVGELVADTHRTLKGFTADRKKMAAEQAKDLASFTNGLSKNVDNLLKKAQQMIAEFHKTNKQMSREQAKELAAFVNDLTGDVRSMLSGFEKHRSEMSKETKDRLAKEIRDIQTQVEKILGDADKFIGEFSSDMAQARKAWKDMSTRLAKARKAGFVAPKFEAKGKETKVGPEITGGKSRKKAVEDSRGSRETVRAAY